MGIGGGCFTPDSIVRTETGTKTIFDVKIGDKIQTHTGKWQKVLNKFKFTDKKKIIKINDIKSTENHEFYVLDKKYKNIVNDDNIHKYAKWIPAKNLNKNYLLIKNKS